MADTDPVQKQMQGPEWWKHKKTLAPPSATLKADNELIASTDNHNGLPRDTIVPLIL